MGVGNGVGVDDGTGDGVDVGSDVAVLVTVGSSILVDSDVGEGRALSGESNGEIDGAGLAHPTKQAIATINKQ